MALCSLGVGCDEYGVCYAEKMGEPDRCGRPDDGSLNADCEKYGHPESPNQYPDGTPAGHCPCGLVEYVNGEPVSRETGTAELGIVGTVVLMVLALIACVVLFSWEDSRCEAIGGHSDSSVSTRGPVCIKDGKLVNP